MITIEDKIRTFSKYVYDKEVKQKDGVLQVELSKQERIRREAKERMEEKSSAALSRQKKKLDLEAQRMLATAKQEARNILHETRRSLYEDLLQTMKKNILDHLDTPEYKAALKADLDRLLEQGAHREVRLWLRPEDQKDHMDWIREIHPYVLMETLDEEAMGGVLVEFPQEGMRVDRTWKSRLTEMENELGIHLYEVLDEAVAEHD